MCRPREIEHLSGSVPAVPQPAVPANPEVAPRVPPTTRSEGPASESIPDLEAWAPPPTPIHGPAFRSLSKEQKLELIRIHRNLGHPAPLTLATHLQAAGADPKMIAAAKDYQCDVCLETPEPRHQRPSKLHDPKEFNHTVGIDGFTFTSRSGFNPQVVHVLDEASCFHLGRRVEVRHPAPATKLTKLVADVWFAWAGFPKHVYVDPAGEFRSEEWLEFLQSFNAKVFVTTGPWQRGRLERHGDIVKHMLERLDADNVLASESAFDAALLQCFQAKNALVRHDGYAPEQIVLDKSIRLPGSNASDETSPAHALAEGQDMEAERQRRRLELRCRARQAFLSADNAQAIRRAALRRSNPTRGPYTANQWVRYWMRKRGPNRLAAGRWHGPAKVICQEGQIIVWVFHGPKIIRCSPEHLRPASLREWMLTKHESPDLPTISVGGSSTYIDLYAQEGREPNEPSPPAAPMPPAPVNMPLPSNAPAAAVNMGPGPSIPEDNEIS